MLTSKFLFHFHIKNDQIYTGSFTISINTRGLSSTHGSCGAQQIFPELLVGGVSFDERLLFLGELIAWLLSLGGGRDGGAVRIWWAQGRGMRGEREGGRKRRGKRGKGKRKRRRRRTAGKTKKDKKGWRKKGNGRGGETKLINVSEFCLWIRAEHQSSVSVELETAQSLVRCDGLTGLFPLPPTLCLPRLLL